MESAAEQSIPLHQPTVREIAAYFLQLGALGFGGPVALVNYMQRDLLDERKWVTRDEFLQGVAIAQTMPGPLAWQTAIWIGYIRAGIAGASAAGITFILPPFLLVVGVAALYVQFEGLWWVQALFQGIGPAVIAIIFVSAYGLARRTNGADPKLWAIFAVLMAVTVVTRTEIAYLFVLAGLVGVLIYAPPFKLAKLSRFLPAAVLLPVAAPCATNYAVGLSPSVSLQLLGTFVKAGALTFGSGLAVIPFLHNSLVEGHHWLTEQQFLDAVAMGVMTPGPVVIMATFAGYLTTGPVGALIATMGVFLPVYFLIIVPGPWLKRYGDRAPVKAFVKGATAAAMGALAGAAIVIAQDIIDDWDKALIAVVSLALLIRMKTKEPMLVGMAGVVGILIHLSR